MKKFIISITLITTVALAGGHNKPGVAPVENKLYLNECSACHFAYQPGLLPERSWRKLMANLDNHFDTDASVDAEDNKSLLDYLTKNAADNSTQFKRSRKINKKIKKDESPIAVTQTRYFQHEHKGIPKRFITQKEVRSLSNCMACHTTADRGIYSERAIDIPNYGRWDDD